ncbi:MAG TPA: DISARM system helicase DrmA [Mesotoga infera]|nr:DISARM system helicase DrmA [Mesotoga infera]
MSERMKMIVSLAKEVLGPRNGCEEAIEGNPRSEYITGILAPRDFEERSIEADSDLPKVEINAEEDESEEDTAIADSLISPALQPKSLPRSMGISFAVRNHQNVPKIDICTTWARYSFEEQKYRRKARFFHTGELELDNFRDWMTEDSIRIIIKSTSIQDSVWRVTVFLANESTINPDDRFEIQTSSFVFQPEIRVKCCEGTVIIPLAYTKNLDTDKDEDSLESEDASLDLLYRKKPALARGHLVGATWKEIDPQRPHLQNPTIQEPPFFWIDSNIVPEDIMERFILPDVRTDYLPMYPVEAPRLDWDAEAYGKAPELDPGILAAMWNQNDMERALKPIVKGYGIWLKRQLEMQSVDPLSDAAKETASRLLKKAEEAIKTIDEGINLIEKNDEIRLAFCFANRAIALQYEWRDGSRNFKWRLFQLAFILMNLPGLSREDHPDRDVCDLLWFATGGGKTEAYLGLAAFIIALRRLRAERDSEGMRYGAGTAVISRYTLRLLTIQQFRRALKLITACEYLRVYRSNGKHGWRPENCDLEDDFLWGTARFSAGLWVGGNVTPNSIKGFTFPRPQGGFQEIKGAVEVLSEHDENFGEPAQILTCPCCNSILAVRNDGLDKGEYTINLIFTSKNEPRSPSVDELSLGTKIKVSDYLITNAGTNKYTLTIKFGTCSDRVKPKDIDNWWTGTISRRIGVDPSALVPARASRPGYVLTGYVNNRGNLDYNDFMVFCPNPGCKLNTDVEWKEKVPVGIYSRRLQEDQNIHNSYVFQMVPEFTRVNRQFDTSNRIPIPALTVDDQIYKHCPTLIVATADKFARLAFDPMTASIFGNVEYYHARYGYYRKYCLQPSGQIESPTPHPTATCMHRRVNPLPPPSLIIQDELHLIEGPLGSMAGIYETSIDELCKRGGQGAKGPKYIVSTATIRQAGTQVRSLFNRTLRQFPAFGTDIDDNFFSISREIHPFDDEKPGRLYIGVCAPGKGAQTPLVRIYSSCLQTPLALRNAGISDEKINGFWTLIGYFNAIRELAGAVALLRQDIPQRMRSTFGDGARSFTREILELSSRRNSMQLPGLLDALEKKLDDSSSAVDIALSTSMFGTGVDIDRLRLMIVNGQPKSTASYIQSTGRVGRREGGVVVTFFRASRPRDLAHYEFFTGYHRAIHKYVEPVTVAPFSSRCRERALGPVIVILLRIASEIQGISVSPEWRYQQRLAQRTYATKASRMSNERYSSEVAKICSIIVSRSQEQPAGRKPDKQVILDELNSWLDRWQKIARDHGDTLLYSESSMNFLPQHPVVLGDIQHYFRRLDQVFTNSPQSLRDVEATTTFRT